ncbi:G-protein coupled receptor GRL101 [Stylophora pistillata]|uniref:G-protein coupled receptor GRL101 n=1 Tax=Stylophora pistillata TaxID=50429 RepID=A0A2B4RCL0_STYPI|nr:G-protein coupled receptor GRL101 [Stylophora pistillata]
MREFARRLRGNRLEKLPGNLLQEMSALEEVKRYQSRNLLGQSLRLTIFKFIVQYIFIRLGEGRDLSYNQLQSLPRGILSSNTNLKVLFLSSNKLQRLPKLKNLSEIETLAVYENNIEYLQPGVFKGLTNMQSMSFYFNKIRTVSNEQFKDIAPSIRFLYFHYNQMRELPDGFFSNMKNLITTTVDTNLMCCHLRKEDADCDFAYVDSFASCERMLKDRAPRICLWVVGIMTLVGAVFVIVWRLVFKETKEKNKIQAIMLINLAGSDGLMGVYLIIIGSAQLIAQLQQMHLDASKVNDKTDLNTPQVRGVINAKLRPLWDYLIAKLGRNQNVEAQDQGMEMRVIEEGTHSIHFSTDCNKFENATSGSQKPRTEQNDQRIMRNSCSCKSSS